MTFTAAIASLFLSGFANPLARTDSREDYPPHLVTRSDHLVPLTALEVGSGGRTRWTEDLRNEVSGRSGFPEPVSGDQLPQVLTDVANHININVLRRPIGLTISYVVTF